MKRITLTILAYLLFTSTSFANSNFTDVNENTYYKTAIEWMEQNQIINGYPDGTFRPNVCVNRVEFLKMLFNTLNVDIFSYETDLFSDTPNGEWYTQYVFAGRARKTINGYSDGSFKPEQCVNRVEAIKMAILEFNDGEIPAQSGIFETPYDIAKITDNTWWKPYFESAMGSNLVGTNHFTTFNADWSGMKVESDFTNPTYNFGPGEPMTRKEVAEMLYRIKALKDSGERGSYIDGLKPNPIIIATNTEIAFSRTDNPFGTLNIETGTYTEILTEDYELLAANSYTNNPPVLLFRKGTQLFNYDIVNKKLEKIEIDPIQESEIIYASVSITDNTKFKISIFNTIESEGMYGYEVISSRYFFYDSISNKLEAIKNDAIEKLLSWNSGCSEYDSENNRIFYWPCGEGIGSAVPLLVYNIETDESQELISKNQFGTEYGAKVRYKEGRFIIISRRYDNDKSSYTPEIIVVEPKKNINILKYTFDPTKIFGSSIYGAMHIPEKDLFVIGGGQDITFLKYNSENKIYEMNKIDLGPAYVNFLFYDGTYIYITVKDHIYKIYPNNAKIIKEITLGFLTNSDTEITTLFY